jgi:quercetin dioxygenase-like cupin family protein
MGAFDDLAAIPPQQLRDGILARSVHGDLITLGVVELDPDVELPEHSHANEQFGIVLSGSVDFRVGDETRTLGPGGTWRIPANTPHFVVAGSQGAVVIDVFTPTRDDWQGLERLEPRTPRWPLPAG